MANATPHTHEMQIRDGENYVFFTYGDQNSTVYKRIPGWRGRVERKAARMVKRHDKGSMQYAERQVKRQEVEKVAEVWNERLLTTSINHYGRVRLEPIEGAWGTDKPEVLDMAKSLHVAYEMHTEWTRTNYIKNAKIDQQAVERGQKQMTA